jgi:tripartite ATP-independent transporter DctM subunit
MEPLLVGVIGVIALLLLLGVGVHIGFAMAIIGFLGFTYLGGLGGGLAQMQITPFVTASNYLLMALPLFLLMGHLLSYAGITSDLYESASKWLGHFPCGLGMATVVGAGAFAAVSGSSLATAGTIGAIAFPEMRRYGYHNRLAAGCVAAGGTLVILIPPSIPMIIFGYTTETSVGQLFIAGIIPGFLSVFLYMAMLFMLPKFRPGIAPNVPAASWHERLRSLSAILPILLIFLLVIGGIYAGVFIPTEAGAVGAAGSFVIALAMRRLSRAKMVGAFMDSARVTAMALMIAMGAIVFVYFMSISRLPVELANLIIGLKVNRYIILIAMLIVYFLLGCFLDVLGLILLTVPIFFPLIVGLGFSPVWFGVLLVKMCEVALITPPVGLNVYVMAGVARDVPMEEIFLGILPFLAMDITMLALLVAFPSISLFLPSLMY